MKLSDDLSAYLDFLRFTAALAVLLGHLQQDGIALAWLGLTHFSHEAVVVFFVLSGFIIHHSTTRRATSAVAYAAARLARVYSVALPAVLACSLLAIAVPIAGGAWGDLAAHPSFRAFSWSDIASSLLFLNESWLNPADLSLNAPYWSLCYEVWFYVLFGVFIFVKGHWRWPLVALAGLVAGPAILVLLPVWLMGGWLSTRMSGSRPWPALLGWTGFLLPLVLIVLINQSGLDLQMRGWLKQQMPSLWRLGSSQRFLTDYLVGALVVLHIASFASLPQRVRAGFLRWRGSLAALAGFSFTLYLFHRPLTIALGLYRPAPEGERLYPLMAALGILLVCWGLSFLTERQLPRWKRAVTRLLPVPGATGPMKACPLERLSGGAGCRAGRGHLRPNAHPPGSRSCKGTGTAGSIVPA